MESVLEKLFSLRDEKYAEFQHKITPTLPKETFIGVRVPELRKLAKVIPKAFLNTLPHEYYDENMLHSLMLCEIRDFDECILEVERFLPHIDNWAVCDVLSPKVFKKHRGEVLEKIRVWSASEVEYTARFGIEILMNLFLDGEFRPEYLEIPAGVHLDAYYVRMMVAWFFATALAKQWDAAIPYIENHRLEPWIHNKTIQKARESYRLTAEQKEYLKKWKI